MDDEEAIMTKRKKRFLAVFNGMGTLLGSKLDTMDDKLALILPSPHCRLFSVWPETRVFQRMRENSTSGTRDDLHFHGGRGSLSCLWRLSSKW